MKKFLFLFIMVLCFFALFGCKKNNQKTTYEIALITDIGDIDDESFNQGAWEGVKAYVEGKNLTYQYYKPTAATDDAYIAAIDLAISNGAKIVVTPGYMFETPVNISQKNHPDVNFILLDGNPANATDGTLENNTYSIFYAEDQAGYLAGYAAVKDGYRNLAFMGGMAVPAVVRYGFGYVLGADAAAKDLGENITMKYHYTGGFSDTPEVQSTAASLYASGTEIIFGCGGSLGKSVMAAAEDANKKVIGVDVDQYYLSTTVITSAMKGLTLSVKNALDTYYAGNWNQIGGHSVTLGASKNGIGLAMEHAKFDHFTQADYDALYTKLSNGEITIDINVTNATDLNVTNTTVTIV